MKNTVDYYWGLRTLMNAWAKAGNFYVDSADKPGTRVKMMPADVALDYADRGLRVVLASGLPYHEQLAWWEKKDRSTRGVMAGYVRHVPLPAALATGELTHVIVQGAGRIGPTEGGGEFRHHVAPALGRRLWKSGHCPYPADRAYRSTISSRLCQHSPALFPL